MHPTENQPTVLHLVYSVEHGGTERVLSRLAPQLAKRGLRQIVCTQRAAGSRAQTLGEDIEVVSLGASARQRFAFIKLADVIQRRAVDVVHARNWGTWTDAMLAARLARRAVVLLGFHGLQVGSSFARARRWRARILGMNRQRFTAVSQAGKAQLIRELHCRDDRIQVIPNGVDTSRFSPADPLRRLRAREALGLGDRDFVMGNVGNFFSAVKGHRVLLKAFAMQARSDDRAKLVLVGGGPMLRDAREAVRRYGLTDRVTFTGMIEDPTDVLAALDLYVCPSLAEGMSNAVLEAMASALPCVVTDVSDHRAMFAAIDPQAVVAVNDSAALARAMARVAAAPRRSQRAAVLSRAHVERRYGFSRMVDHYGRLYAEVASARRASHPVLSGGASLTVDTVASG